MAMNTGTVASFIAEGCGRCDKFQTPDCKVHLWPAEIAALRAVLTAPVLVDAGLVETMKWGAPCYTHRGKNVAALAVTRTSAGVSFFQGALLEDAHGLLEKPGPNSRHARIARFTSVTAIQAARGALTTHLERAMAIALEGQTVDRAPTAAVPAALQTLFDADTALHAAWAALTPGRQRSHVLHIGGAKQDATRARRALKCAAKIRAGKGFNER